MTRGREAGLVPRGRQGAMLACSGSGEWLLNDGKAREDENLSSHDAREKSSVGGGPWLGRPQRRGSHNGVAAVRARERADLGWNELGDLLDEG